MNKLSEKRPEKSAVLARHEVPLVIKVLSIADWAVKGLTARETAKVAIHYSPEAQQLNKISAIQAVDNVFGYNGQPRDDVSIAQPTTNPDESKDTKARLERIREEVDRALGLGGSPVVDQTSSNVVPLRGYTGSMEDTGYVQKAA